MQRGRRRGQDRWLAALLYANLIDQLLCRDGYHPVLPQLEGWEVRNFMGGIISDLGRYLPLLHPASWGWRMRGRHLAGMTMSRPGDAP